MNYQKLSDASQFFLSLCDSSQDFEKSKLEVLLQNLSTLQSHVLQIDLGTLQGTRDSVESEAGDSQLQEKISASFPELGLYQVLSSTNLNNDADVFTGDAIDDLLDIYGDISTGLVYWKSGNIDEALWHWRFSYDTHWGKHLVQLQVVLKELLHDLKTKL